MKVGDEVGVLFQLNSAATYGFHMVFLSQNTPTLTNSHGHSLDDAQAHGVKLCGGNKQRKRHEMRFIFQLGTWQPRGLNSDFRLGERQSFQSKTQMFLWRGNIKLSFH